MAGFRLSSRSKERLDGVHDDLRRVVYRAIVFTTVDFAVLEGLRTFERQRELVDAGASRTMHSRHLTGHAVDLGAWVGGRIAWDWPLYHQIYNAMNAAAIGIDVDLEWGGNWRSFPDGPHFQLSREAYPV
jgi:peptidoglycan L-alanyl-D-glutamate endopeptidase CwlK